MNSSASWLSCQEGWEEGVADSFEAMGRRLGALYHCRRTGNQPIVALGGGWLMPLLEKSLEGGVGEMVRLRANKSSSKIRMVWKAEGEEKVA
jgi:hypothetical protein